MSTTWKADTAAMAKEEKEEKIASEARNLNLEDAVRDSIDED